MRRSAESATIIDRSPPLATRTTNEPALEIMALFALRKLFLQSRMRSHPTGLDIWFLVGPFVYFHTLCVRTAKALARLRECAGSPEPSLVAFVISTIISWAGSDHGRRRPVPFYPSEVNTIPDRTNLTSNITKADEKAKIRNWYNRIPHSAPNTQWERNTHTHTHTETAQNKKQQERKVKRTALSQ